MTLFNSLGDCPYEDDPRLGCKANDTPFDPITKEDPTYRTYFYDSPNHELWTALTVGAKFLGVDPSTLEKRLPPGTETLPGKNASNRRIEMIRLSVMQHAVADIFEHPQVMTEGEYKGFFEDENGQLWTTIVVASEHLGIDFDVIKKNLPKNVPTIKARNSVNVLQNLYPWPVMQHGVANVLALDNTDPYTYLEKNNLHFGSIKQISQDIGVSETVPKNRRGEKVREIEAKIRGVPTTLYCLEDILKDPTIQERLTKETKKRLKTIGIIIPKIEA